MIYGAKVYGLYNIYSLAYRFSLHKSLQQSTKSPRGTGNFYKKGNEMNKYTKFRELLAGTDFQDCDLTNYNINLMLEHFLRRTIIDDMIERHGFDAFADAIQPMLEELDSEHKQGPMDP